MLEEEEKKEVEVVEEEPKEQPEAKQPEEAEVVSADEAIRNALVAFILAAVAVTVCFADIPGGIAAVVLGILSLNFQAKAKDVEKQPHKTFLKIANPVAKIVTPVGAVSALAFLIFHIVRAIAEAA